MAIIKDKIETPCKECIHREVCSLVGKMEETAVSLHDDHFKALIECSAFIPVLMKQANEEE